MPGREGSLTLGRLTLGREGAWKEGSDGLGRDGPELDCCCCGREPWKSCSTDWLSGTAPCQNNQQARVALLQQVKRGWEMPAATRLMANFSQEQL